MANALMSGDQCILSHLSQTQTNALFSNSPALETDSLLGQEMHLLGHTLRIYQLFVFGPGLESLCFDQRLGKEICANTDFEKAGQLHRT
jgi:hypothetical protein